MEKVNTEIARKDVEAWLDYKRVSERKRETLSENIENLIDFVSEGILYIDDKKNIVHNLIFPLKSDDTVTMGELTYKPFLTVENIVNRTKGIKGADPQETILAYTSALTEKSVNILKKMKSDDYSVSQNITAFFF